MFSPVTSELSTISPVVYMMNIVFGGKGITETQAGRGAAVGVTLAIMVMIVFGLMNMLIKDDDIELYSFENSRILYRSILWASHSEDELHKWFSSNFNVEVHAYVKNGKYCVVNNTYEPQSTTVYKGDGSSFELDMDANEIRWYEI